MQSEQSDTCFWQNGRMNPKLQFDRRARRRAMPIVGCAFARYNLNVRFWQNEPNRFLLGCPCLDVPAWMSLLGCPYLANAMAFRTRRRTERRALRMNRRSGPGRQWGSVSSRIALLGVDPLSRVAAVSLNLLL